LPDAACVATNFTGLEKARKNSVLPTQGKNSLFGIERIEMVMG